MKPIDDLILDYRGARAEVERMYPWIGEASRSVKQAMNDPLWVVNFVETQEQNYGMTPGMAGLFTDTGLGGANPATAAAGLAESDAYPYGGPLSDQATGYGTSDPTSGFSSNSTSTGAVKNQQFDQANNAPPSVQEQVDMMNGVGGGGRPGTVKPYSPPSRRSGSGTFGPSAPVAPVRTPPPRRPSALSTAQQRRIGASGVATGVAEEQVGTTARGGSGRGSALAAPQQESPFERARRRALAWEAAPAPKARELSVDVDAQFLPEQTTMRGRPGQFVTRFDAATGRIEKVTLQGDDGKAVPLIYNANGRPTVAALSPQGDVLISPLSGRTMAMGLDGTAFDVLTGDDEFKQGLLHKVWFGDAGDDGIINSGDERAGDNWWGGVWTGVKTVGRVGFTALETVPRMVDQMAMMAAGDVPEGFSAGQAVSELPIFNLLGNSFKGNWWDQTVLEKNAGTGWGLGGAAYQQREDFARSFGTTKGGRVWGAGPAITSKLFGLDPDSGVGAEVSGFIDAGKLILLDPSTWLAPEAKLFMLPAAGFRGAKVLSKAPTAAKGAKWATAKDAYAWAATTATGQSTGRLAYVPGSRLASHIMGKDVYWGLRPVERVVEREVDAANATAYAERGMEGIEGEGPLEGVHPRAHIGVYDDDELAEFAGLRHALTDDRHRVSLPPIGQTRQVGSTPFMETRDASEWAGTLWYSSDDPAHVARLLDPSTTLPIPQRHVYAPLPEDFAGRARYVAVDNLLSRYGIDADTPITNAPAAGHPRISQAGGEAVITAFVTEKGLGISKADLEWAASRRRVGLRQARVELYGAARLSSDDADLLFDGDDEVAALFGEHPDYSDLPQMGKAANGYGALFRSGTVNPVPDTLRPHRYEVGDEPGTMRESLIPTLGLSTAPMNPNRAGASRPKQTPWFNMEFDPAGMRVAVDMLRDDVDIDDFAGGFTDALEWQPQRGGAAASPDELLASLRAVYINRDMVDWMKANGTWTPDQEASLRAIDDQMRALIGRHASGTHMPRPFDKGRGVGRWQGWEVWRADGMAASTVPSASPLTRDPGGNLILGPGGREVETPAAFVADSLRATIPPEAAATLLVNGTAVDTLGYMTENKVFIEATNRTLTGSGQDPSQVNVTFLPQADDRMFVGVNEVVGAGARQVDPTAPAEVTVPRTSRNPDHLRGVHAPSASLPTVAYVVGDVTGQHLTTGGRFRPRETVPGVGPSDLGDKAATDMSRRRGNVRLHSDIDSAFKYQKAAALLSKVSRLHAAWRWPKLQGSMGDTFNNNVPYEALDGVAREVEAAFGEQAAKDFLSMARDEHAQYVGQVPGLKQVMDRDPFTIMVEKPLMEALYGPDGYDPDDLLGLEKWRKVDATKIEVGRVQMSGVKGDGAKVRRYEDQGADLRVYGDVRPDAVIRNTGPDTNDVVTRRFPSEPYELIDYKPEPDLVRPEDLAVYRAPGEFGRIQDVEQPRPGFEAAEVREARAVELTAEIHEVNRRVAEINADEALSSAEKQALTDPLNERYAELADERRQMNQPQWDTQTEEGIRQTLEEIREYQIAEGTIQPGERPKFFHATLAGVPIANTGLLKGTSGGALGGTAGARGTSLTFSGIYADVVREHYVLYSQVDRIWRSDAPMPERAAQVVRTIAADFDYVNDGTMPSLPELLDDAGEPHVAEWIAGNVDFDDIDDVNEALKVIRDVTRDNDGVNDWSLDLTDLTRVNAQGHEAGPYVAVFGNAGNRGFSYSDFRQRSLVETQYGDLLGREPTSLATNPGIMREIDPDTVRMLQDEDIDIIEFDAEDVLRDAAARGVSVRPKPGFGKGTVDWEKEMVHYGDLAAPDDWRMAKLGGNIPFVQPEIKYNLAASQVAARKAVGAVELPTQADRIGGAWDKRGVQRAWAEWERKSQAEGWVRETVWRPRAGETPARTGPDGRPEFDDAQLIEVVKWTAPVSQRAEGVQEHIDDVLDMGPIQRKAAAGVVEGQARVVVPRSFDLYMRHGDGRELVQAVISDDTLTMAKRFNGKVDVSVLGQVVKIKKKYAGLMAAPDADIPMLEAKRAKDIEDEFTLAASRGLWEGNPKATNWRKGWTPRLLDHMPGDNVVITDPGMATSQVLRWANAMRVDDMTTTRLLEGMLDASTPEGRLSILEATAEAGERVIVSKQFQYAPREIREMLRVLNDLPDEGYGDLPSIRRHLIGRGFEGGSADTAAEYAAHVHATARNATRMWKKEWEEARTYMRDLVAKNESGDVRGPDGEPVAVASSLMLAEMIESTVPMPNARDLMRLTSRQGAWFQYAARQAKISGMGPSAWLKTKAGRAYQGVVDTVLERYTQDWFKPMVLVRAAYILRVIPEEQARMWASGWVNTVTRPMDYWMVTSGKSNRYMIDGRPWDKGAAVTDNEPNLYAEAVGQRYRAAQSRERVSQVVKSFDRRGAVDFNDPEMVEYGYGYATTLANLHMDPVVRRLAGGWVPSDFAEMPSDLRRLGTDRQKMDWWFYNSETGRRYLRSMIENQRNDPDLTDLWASTPEGVSGWVDDQQSYLDRYTQGQPEFREVVATGKYGGKKKPIMRSQRWTDIDPDFADTVRTGVRRMDRATLPDVKYVTKEHQSQRKATMDRLGDAAMNMVVGAPTRVLSRSPVFKTRYSEHITDLIPLASPNARARILDSDWYGDLTGQQRRRVDMAIRDAGSDEGALQFQDIDSVAKQRALSDTTGTLYDFSTKTVLADVMRNISPFFTAWSEAIAVWTRLFASNPRVASRLNMAIQGGQSPNALDFMYDKDERHAGQGFFWNDPATGEMKFTYPFVDFGAPFPLTGNLKNLNMVATLTPGLGPTVTTPAAAMLKPNTDNDAAYALRNVISMVNGGIAPSSDPAAMFGLGAWTKNFIAAYAPALGGSQTQGMYANALSDARRYLVSTDEGMLTDKDFEAKADQLATQLLTSRGFAQFFLPTVADHRATAYASGRLFPEPRMIEQSALSDMYRTYNDTYGFNEGNQRFLQDFGRGGFLAAGGVNKYDGYLDYTATQWNFIRKNPELTREYRSIIGLIAPPSAEGEKFNFDAYRYSQESGMRQPKTSGEYQADIQTRLGKLILDRADTQGLDDTGKRALRQYLHQQLPLFTDFSGSAEERAQNTNMMYDVAQDERVPADTRQAISTYLSMRDQALLSVGDPAKAYNPDWSAKKRKAAAASLYASGQRLAQTNRGFTRSWEYLFSRELESALGL